ncbi:MAG: plasmid replication protein, CyRepA1 family, partial [Pseudanabaena sp.]
MSKFTSTKKGLICPICDDNTGKCRIVDSITLCMNSPDGLIETSGYKYLHASKDGLWGIYTEDNEQTHSNEAKRIYKAQKVERDLITKHKHETSLNLIERDREYRKLIKQLPLSDRALSDLIRRGLTAEQIKRMLFASVGQWHPLRHVMTTQLAGVIGKGNKLNVMADGYLVPIPNIDGLLIGSQYRVFEPIDGNKYPWLTSKTKNNPDGASPHLPNGELPMGVYRPQNLIKKGVVGIPEGYLKPSITAEKVGHICFGMASGNYAGCPEQFEQALKLIETEQGIKPYLLLYPDAGAIQNPHVMNTYSNTYKLAIKLGYEMKVAWHGQISKTKHQDIDELDSIDGIKEISWYEFLGLQHKALKDESVTISQRYLTDLEIPESAKLVCLRSPKGTNKTGYIAKYVDGQRGRKRFLVICHRSQLTQQLGHRLGLRTHYELENATGDIKAAIATEISLFGMVTTWDSLHKINPDDWKNCEIILDEAEQSIWHLLNSTTDIENYRVDTIAMFTQLLQECDRIWLLDADLSNTAIDFVSGLTDRQDFKPYIVLNNYVFEEPWNVTIYSGNEPTGVQQKLFEYLGIGKKCLLHLDSQKSKGRYSGANIERMVNKQYPQLKTLLIDSHTVQNPDHPAYRILTDANICDRLAGYDLVICTPTVETGVSIDKKGLFDAVFGIFFGVVSADSVRQALARYREPVERHIWAKTYSPISGNPDYKQALTMQSKATRAHTRGLQDADLKHIDVNPSPVALTTWAKMQARVKADALRFREAIIDGLKADGHIVKSADDIDKAESKKLLEIATANRDKSYSEKCEEIMSQITITDDRAQQIDASKSRTDEDEDQLRKYKLNKSYGVEVTSELVKLDDGGLYKKLRLLYFLTDGKEYLKPRDKAKLTNLLNSKGQVWQPTVNKSLLIGQIDLLRKLDIVNVLMQPDKEYRGTDVDLVKFKKRVIKHRYDFKTMFGITINPDAGAISISNQLLNILGLKLNEVSRDRLADGKVGSRVYKFMPILGTDIRYQILQNWLKVDAQKLAQKMPEMIDISSTELDPPKIIINTITDAGSKLGPITPQAKNAIQWRKGMKAMYQGLGWS